MQYMLIITQDEALPGPQPGEPAFDAEIEAWNVYTRDLMQSGALVSGASLQPTSTATTVRQVGGVNSIVDGPFAETKEQFAGYYLIDVADLDAALEWAKRTPTGDGSIEVRPVSMMPDAAGTPQYVD